MSKELPPFIPHTQAELRELWAIHSDHDVRRLVLEVVRYRKVLEEVDQLYRTTHQAWRDTNGGNLVALHLLQKLLDAERDRLG